MCAIAPSDIAEPAPASVLKVIVAEFSLVVLSLTIKPFDSSGIITLRFAETVPDNSRKADLD
jgi:hypothetical protein